MTGSGNLAQGNGALSSNTTGSLNIAQGASTMVNNTSGSENVAQGNFSLYFNTTGNNNIAQGTNALGKNTSGSYNIALGKNALSYNDTTSSSTAIGSFALRYITTLGNTALGYQAGVGDGVTTDQQSTLDDYATFIGFQASRDGSIFSSTALTNITAIGKNAKVGQSNSLILGGIGTDAVTVGIGTTSPSSTLTVRGTGATNPFLVASSTGASLFTILANGNVGIGTSTPGAKLAVSGQASADYFTVTGVNATSSFGEVNFAATNPGLSAANWLYWQGQKFITASNYNTFVGVNSGINASTTAASSNNGHGLQALSHVTLGSYNNAFGTFSLDSLMTGSSNDAFGELMGLVMWQWEILLLVRIWLVLEMLVLVF
jgi:hypothetical protein